MGGFIVEFCSFLRVRKKFWLTPIMMIVLVVGPLLRATQGLNHRASQTRQRHSRKAQHKLDAQRKIVIAGAVIAEARDDPAFEVHIKAIVRKRVTRRPEVTAVAEWLNTVQSQGTR